MKRILKWTLVALLAAFLAIQVVQPDRTEPDIDRAATLDALFSPPPEVASLLRAACYDCHSYETRWPWYSRVAPVSWLIGHDIEEGRGSVNFSTLGALDPDEQRDLLRECAREVKKGAMPLEIYTKLHADARLSEGQRDALNDWFRDAAKRAR